MVPTSTLRPQPQSRPITEFRILRLPWRASWTKLSGGKSKSPCTKRDRKSYICVILRLKSTCCPSSACDFSRNCCASSDLPRAYRASRPTRAQSSCIGSSAGLCSKSSRERHNAAPGGAIVEPIEYLVALIGPAPNRLKAEGFEWRPTHFIGHFRSTLHCKALHRRNFAKGCRTICAIARCNSIRSRRLVQCLTSLKRPKPACKNPLGLEPEVRRFDSHRRRPNQCRCSTLMALRQRK